MDFKKSYSKNKPESWAKTKFLALPRTALAGMKALGHAILFCVSWAPKVRSPKTQIYRVGRDLQEGLGQITSLFWLSKGQLIVQKAKFNKSCYDVELFQRKHLDEWLSLSLKDLPKDPKELKDFLKWKNSIQKDFQKTKINSTSLETPDDSLSYWENYFSDFDANSKTLDWSEVPPEALALVPHDKFQSVWDSLNLSMKKKEKNLPFGFLVLSLGPLKHDEKRKHLKVKELQTLYSKGLISAQSIRVAWPEAREDFDYSTMTNHEITQLWWSVKDPVLAGENGQLEGYLNDYGQLMKPHKLMDPGTIPTKVIDCDVKEMSIGTLQKLIQNKGLPKQFYPHLTKEQLNELTKDDWKKLVSSRQDLHMLLFQPIHKRISPHFGNFDIENTVKEKEDVQIPQTLKQEWTQKGWLPQKGQSKLPIPKALADLGVSFNYSPNKESPLWFEKELNNARYFSETFDYVDEYGRYTPRINVRNQFPICGSLAPYEGNMESLNSIELNKFLEDDENIGSFPKFLIPRLTKDQLKGLSEKAWGNLIRSPQDAQALFFKVDYEKEELAALSSTLIFIDPNVTFRKELWALVPNERKKSFLKQMFLPSGIEDFDDQFLEKDSSLYNEASYTEDVPLERQLPFWKEQQLGMRDAYGRFQRSPGPKYIQPFDYNTVATKTTRTRAKNTFTTLDSSEIGEMIDNKSFPKRLYPHLSAEQIRGLSKEQLSKLIQNKEDFRAIFYSIEPRPYSEPFITTFSLKEEHWNALSTNLQEQFRREGYLAS